MNSRINSIRMFAALLLAAFLAVPAVGQEFLADWEGSYSPDAWYNPPPSQLWGNFEILAWWRSGRNTPPLVTTGSAADAAPGALGEPGTQLLFGGERIGDRIRPGARGSLGVWFGPYETVGLGTSFFALGQQTTQFGLSSDGTTILAIPFLDPGAVPNALLVAQAGQAGTINVRSGSDAVGGDLFLRGYMLQGFESRIDWTAGYQTARIDEDLVIAASAPGFFTVQDAFATKNEFHGGTFGINGLVRRGTWTCEFMTKLGLGNMRQTVTVSGATDLAPAGGLFVEGVSVSQVKRNKFAVVPEASFKLGYDINPFTRISGGYSMLYFSSIVQPGDQIDTIVGDGLTSLAFNDRGYWLHGASMSLDWRF